MAKCCKIPKVKPCKLCKFCIYLHNAGKSYHFRRIFLSKMVTLPTRNTNICQYIFRILQHFDPKPGNATNFKMLFLTAFQRYCSFCLVQPLVYNAVRKLYFASGLMVTVFFLFLFRLGVPYGWTVANALVFKKVGSI